jgi:transposase-like protein
MATKNKNDAAKGKRYSPAEKQEILEHVEKINAVKGRGGVTAASRKFKVTQLTISSWLKQAGGTRATTLSPGKSRAGTVNTLRELLALAEKMDPLEKELATLEAQYRKLKRML